MSIDFDKISAGMSAQFEQKVKAQESVNFLADFHRANLASEFAVSLLSRINQFNQELDSTKEVGMQLVSFGQTTTFHVQSIGYNDPSLILFNGVTNDGSRIELMQHVSQISFLLISLPKLNPDKPKQKIGFLK